MWEQAPHVGESSEVERSRPTLTDSADLVFQDRILPGVSRTFALTIPQLPIELRRAVSNAYLLCRTADTIEDDARLTQDQKDRFLGSFIELVESGRGAGAFGESLHPLLSERTLAAERELVREIARVVRITHTLAPVQRQAIARCVSIMSRGMGHYERNRSPNGLPTLAELERYCYFVAGVVGEMLTDLFCDYSEEIAANRDELSARAVPFGTGLQMTNILKDVWDDSDRQTCWLPHDLFSDAGFDLRDLKVDHHNAAFAAAMRQLVGVAHGHLRAAFEYCLLIPAHETGIRRFLLWAVGLAVLTLRKIHATPCFESGSDVKISRRSVKAVVGSTNMAMRSNLALSNLYRLSTRGLPLYPAPAARPASAHEPSLSSS